MSYKVSLLLATAATLVLNACASGQPVNAAPVEDDILPMASTLNEELTDVSSSVANMRQQLDILEIRVRILQERMKYAGPMLTPMSNAEATLNVVTEQAPPPVIISTTPTPLMGEMATATPADSPVQISKPVVDEKPKTETKPEAKPAEAAPAPAKGDGVQGVRTGIHADRVRIVLDVAGAAPKFTTNLDGTEKLLTVDLPETKWDGAKSETLKNNPVIASWSAQGTDTGSVLAVSLKGDTKILETKTLKAEGGKPARLIIDLAK